MGNFFGIAAVVCLVLLAFLISIYAICRARSYYEYVKRQETIKNLFKKNKKE